MNASIIAEALNRFFKKSRKYKEWKATAFRDTIAFTPIKGKKQLIIRVTPVRYPGQKRVRLSVVQPANARIQITVHNLDNPQTIIRDVVQAIEKYKRNNKSKPSFLKALLAVELADIASEKIRGKPLTAGERLAAGILATSWLDRKD